MFVTDYLQYRYHCVGQGVSEASSLRNLSECLASKMNLPTVGGGVSFSGMKSLRGKPRSVMFLGFNSLLSQQAAGNLTRERLKIL